MVWWAPVRAARSRHEHRRPATSSATVGSASITLAQLDERALEQPAGSFGSLKLSQALYQARRAAADELVGNLLLDQEAKRLGIDRATLIQQEIADHVTPVTEADISAWYRGESAAGPGGDARSGACTDHAAPAAGAHPGRPSKPTSNIEDEDAGADHARAASPGCERREESGEGRGQCPDRGDRVRRLPVPVLSAGGSDGQEGDGDVRRSHPSRVSQLPAAEPPQARPAAEAALCADEQGQFWPYHDRLFAEAGKLSDADLRKAAAELGMDAARFNTCVDEHRYKAVVDADQQAGNEAGVNGTPAFFVNGRILTGAQPFEAFKRVIDEELELKKK